MLGEAAERRGDAGAREHARAIQHGHTARGHQLEIVVGAEHAVRGHQVGREQAEPVQILRRRAAAIALADGLDLGTALRHVRRDGHAKLARPCGAGLQQIGATGVRGVRAHRKTDAAVAAIVPALIERVPRCHVGGAVVAGIMHHTVRSRLGVRRREQIRRAIEAMPISSAASNISGIEFGTAPSRWWRRP